MTWVQEEIARVRRGETTELNLSYPYHRDTAPVAKISEFPNEILELENLTALDLSNNQLRAVPQDIVRLRRLKRLTLRRNDSLRLPSDLSQLQALQSISVPGVAALAQVTLPPGLQSLDLGHDGVADEIIVGILRHCINLRELGIYGQFQRLDELLRVVPYLESLSLGGYDSVFSAPDFVRISRLSRLRELTLTCARCELVELERLPNLQKVYIYHTLNGSSAAVESIRRNSSIWERLTELRHLSLHAPANRDKDGHVRHLEAPVHIELPSKLEHLGLSGGILPAGFPRSLERMSQLRYLSLGDCEFKEISPVICTLHGLTVLNLYNNRIESIPSALMDLRKLERLVLSENPISRLPENIGQLNRLTSLRLSGSRLTELPESFETLTSLEMLSLDKTPLDCWPRQTLSLPALNDLDLSNTRIREIPSDVHRLKRLRYLQLTGNAIAEIPPAVARLPLLRFLDIDVDNVTLPPSEIVSRGIIAVQGYFRELEESSVELFEAKLIIVGEGEVGKTSLVHKLIDPQFDLGTHRKRIESTRGIGIAPWVWRSPKGQEFKVSVWDFGGQEIYHSTHQFFLTKRSLYLFIWDARKEDRLAGFDYWLNIVRLLSANSPILVVLNKADERIKEIEQRSLTAKFKNIVAFHKVSALTGQGMRDLTEDIQRELLRLPHVGDLWPVRWNNVRVVLKTHAREYIDRQEYLDICGAEGLDEERALLLSNYLHDLGVILHFQDDPLLQKIVILKPEWGTDAVYAVLDTRSVQRARGRFDVSALRTIWSRTRYPPSRHAELLQLMIRFELCFPLGNTGVYVAPELLSEEAPDYPWDPVGNLRFEYVYDFMPAGILPRLIARMHSSIEGDFFWKNGLIASSEGARASVVAEPLNRRIRVAVTGGAKTDLLAVVRYEMGQIHKTLNAPDVVEMIPCNCSKCRSGNSNFYDYRTLIRYFAAGVLAMRCDDSLEEVSVEALLTGVLPRSEINREVRQLAPGSPSSIVINNIIPEMRPMENRDKHQHKAIVPPAKTPWASGMFYLLAVLIVLGALGSAAHFYSFSMVILLIVGVILILTVIGALQLKHDGELSQENFLKLMKMAFRKLPGLTAITRRRQRDNQRDTEGA